MRRNVIVFSIVIPLLVATGFALAQERGIPWQDHAPPFDFLFENEIDSHQQSMVLGNDELRGFLYIRFTDEVDAASDAPVAMHGQDAVGWNIRGVPMTATKGEGGWCVDPDDLPAEPGFTHFHPIGAMGMMSEVQEREGFLLQLTATDTFFFRHHADDGGFLISPGIDLESHSNIVTNCP